jgi:hypothetical protein
MVGVKVAEDQAQTIECAIIKHIAVGHMPIRTRTVGCGTGGLGPRSQP